MKKPKTRSPWHKFNPDWIKTPKPSPVPYGHGKPIKKAGGIR